MIVIPARGTDVDFWIHHVIVLIRFSYSTLFSQKPLCMLGISLYIAIFKHKGEIFQGKNAIILSKTEP